LKADVDEPATRPEPQRDAKVEPKSDLKSLPMAQVLEALKSSDNGLILIVVIAAYADGSIGADGGVRGRTPRKIP
jgi:hypothetical protein